MNDSGEDDWDWQDRETPTLDEGITPDLYLQWRSPRFGLSNPQPMNNPVWEWLVRTRVDTFWINDKLKGPSPFDEGPGWCFDRFGRTTTHLPDGRKVMIAGEHEDGYDPDFCIYNDVVVEHPDGKLEIFGYPKEVFPPTDFHTATLWDDQIVMIGNLGYEAERGHGTTQVLILDLKNWTIARKETFGDFPGWIHKHEAKLDEKRKAIIVTKGQIERSADEGFFPENTNDWSLNLESWRWEKLTNRQWKSWRFDSDEKRGNSLWMARMNSIIPASRLMEFLPEGTKKLLEESEPFKPTGHPEAASLVKELYRPPIPHETLPEDEDEHAVFRIRIDGVIVRYVESPSDIIMTVEGVLPLGTVTMLVADLTAKLSLMEQTAYKAVQL